MGPRTAYIVIVVVVLVTASVAALILLGNPFLSGDSRMQSAEAATEPAVSAPAVAESPAALPQRAASAVPAAEKAGSNVSGVRSNTQAKGDRLLAPMPPPEDPAKIGPPSLSLESARQYLLAPAAGIKFRTVFRMKQTTALLDDKQIISIKRRLKLTAAQEKFWPPVEIALREVVQYVYSQRGQPLGKAIDPNSDQVKRLMAAATPFLAHLREDQKNEIISLTRMAGLGSQLPGQKEQKEPKEQAQNQ
ncbi:MAG: hypothetical protein EKK40_14985 [Bradyrhizobiaceae bacterium]|nr:MAG: hypothetical protein EKK40_14985 [Bradyrhizobiaceae bacterium]